MSKGTSKRHRKLARKRERLIKALAKANAADLSELCRLDDELLIRFGYQFCGKTAPLKHLSYAAKHARMSVILGWLRTVERKPKQALPENKINVFYKSYEWRKLRYKVLKKYGATCMVCGRERENGFMIHVDHIKPLRKYWELRLDANNLQVLCDECNHGKGNWDETDWREPELAILMGERIA